jgi:hypothetical protein
MVAERAASMGDVAAGGEIPDGIRRVPAQLSIFVDVSR